jgi:hypothetical protein
VLACLGATALPTTACVIPDGVVAGSIDTAGPAPLADVCVLLLDATGNGIGATISNANGNWTITGLPHVFNAVLAFLPGASDPNSPCAANSNGPPAIPAPGELQPIFYNNIWVDLADPVLLNGPYQWAVAHGATPLTAGASGINVCISTAPGTTLPRPNCTTPAAAALPNIAAGASGGNEPLANTGTPITPMLSTGIGLTILGVLLLVLLARRRGRARWL